jgi:hypothetical protein
MRIMQTGFDGATGATGTAVGHDPGCHWYAVDGDGLAPSDLTLRVRDLLVERDPG